MTLGNLSSEEIIGTLAGKFEKLRGRRAKAEISNYLVDIGQ